MSSHAGHGSTAARPGVPSLNHPAAGSEGPTAGVAEMVGCDAWSRRRGHPVVRSPCPARKRTAHPTQDASARAARDGSAVQRRTRPDLRHAGGRTHRSSPRPPRMEAAAPVGRRAQGSASMMRGRRPARSPLTGQRSRTGHRDRCLVGTAAGPNSEAVAWFTRDSGGGLSHIWVHGVGRGRGIGGRGVCGSLSREESSRSTRRRRWCPRGPRPRRPRREPRPAPGI
jgi:hypothetical protein